MGYRLFHWGPLLTFSLIFSISSAAYICIFELWTKLSIGFVLNSIILFVWIAITFYNYIQACLVGPGYVPDNWKPDIEDDVKNLQHCRLCDAYKAPRSHHCRKCDRCVMKMDHHCPWLNNCVGHFNHAYFVSFLFFAPIGCLHSEGLMVITLYHYLFKNYYIYFGKGDNPIIDLGPYEAIFCIMAVGLSIGVTIAVGSLFILQLRSILKNETGIESWIKEKALYRYHDSIGSETSFVYPYNLGRYKNFKMVFHWKHDPTLNGIWWPVREGCNQFTLTIEQIEQKQEKLGRSILFVAISSFKGSLCPISYGCRVCCCPPCLDEHRVMLNKADKLLVSRFKKWWLYGEKVYSLNQGNSILKRKKERGWFPRVCVVKDISPEGKLLYKELHMKEKFAKSTNKSEDTEDFKTNNGEKDLNIKKID